MTESPPPGYRSPKLTPPRWLAALSVAVGAVLFYFFLLRLWPQGDGAEALAGPQRASLIGVALFFHLGYFVAPFWTGRGPWLSFFAGLALAPAAVGWMVQFFPGGFADPVLAGLALLGLTAILGHYFLIFRHFWIDFQTSRTAGRPD